MQFTLTFVNTTRVFLKWIEPAWVLVDGGQHVLLGIANLKQILRGTIAISDFVVTMNGKEANCASGFKSDGDVDILDCLTPTFPFNTTLATVQIRYFQSTICNGLLVVNGQPAVLSSFEKLPSLQNELPGPAVNFLSPVSYQSTVDFSESVLEYGSIARFVFEVSSPAAAILRPTDIDVQLKPASVSPCRPGTLSEDCRIFKEKGFNLSDISIQVTQPGLLRASGLLDIYGCPPIFCGDAGWGVSFDATVFIKNKRIAERREVLKVIPKGSFPAVQVDPSTVPAMRLFSIAISIKRFWPRPGGILFQVEFQEKNGAVTSGAVQKVDELPDTEYAKVSVVVPPFSVGPVAGRLVFLGKIPQRSITICTFNIFCLDDPPGPARVEWASTTSGPVAGGTEVKLRLSRFPFIDPGAQVNLTI